MMIIKLYTLWQERVIVQYKIKKNFMMVNEWCRLQVYNIIDNMFVQIESKNG